MAERKGKKLRRVAKAKPYYTAQFRKTEANKRRKMMKHLRSNPLDEQTRKAYEFKLNFGSTSGFQLTRKGRRLFERAIA